MSLMGYTDTDVVNMLASIRIGIKYIPDNTSNKDVIEGLQKTYDFLDGLVMEGRI